MIVHNFAIYFWDLQLICMFVYRMQYFLYASFLLQSLYEAHLKLWWYSLKRTYFYCCVLQNVYNILILFI